ncbi:hypothetical protein [Streptomyces albogriseolus]|uniref:hypothetical protein n=1 Tax=Streptomyces albogriseolus TaxID=1887 RepID=UPI003CF402C2
MSSLHEHVAQNRTSESAQTEAEVALLNAITQAVADTKEEGGGPGFEIPRLKDLATAYALVVHGRA